MLLHLPKSIKTRLFTVILTVFGLYFKVIPTPAARGYEGAAVVTPRHST